MIARNSLRGWAVLAAWLLLVPSTPVEAHNRKGDHWYKLGQQAEAHKEYDKAVEYYTKAMHEDPEDPGYQIGLRRARFEASQEHVQAGMKLRKDQKLEEALVEFQKAFNADPGSAIALQEVKETTDLLDQKKKGNVAEPLTPLEQARKESTALIESMLPVPELKPVTNKIPQLKMKISPPRCCMRPSGNWRASTCSSIPLTTETRKPIWT